MKADEFLATFEKTLNQRISKSDIKFAKACWHALKDSLPSKTHLSAEDMPTIQAKYQKTLDKLVENGVLRQEGQKVHWINQSTSDSAQKAFKDLLSTHFSKQEVKDDKKSDVEKKTKIEQKTNTTTMDDDTLFEPNDTHYKGYTDQQIKTLQWAENGCSYPKLVLFLHEKHNWHPHEASKKINQLLANSGEKPITAKEVITGVLKQSSKHKF